MDTGSQFPLPLILLIGVSTLILLFLVVSAWKIFEKAGRPGWKAVIPILNTITFIQIAGRPGWWFLLMLLPVVGLIISVIVTVDFSKRFGKTSWYAVGMILLPIIFYPILAFGDSQYRKETIS